MFPCRERARGHMLSARYEQKSEIMNMNRVVRLQMLSRLMHISPTLCAPLGNPLMLYACKLYLASDFLLIFRKYINLLKSCKQLPVLGNLMKPFFFLAKMHVVHLQLFAKAQMAPYGHVYFYIVHLYQK